MTARPNRAREGLVFLGLAFILGVALWALAGLLTWAWNTSLRFEAIHTGASDREENPPLAPPSGTDARAGVPEVVIPPGLYERLRAEERASASRRADAGPRREALSRGRSVPVADTPTASPVEAVAASRSPAADRPATDPLGVDSSPAAPAEASAGASAGSSTVSASRRERAPSALSRDPASPPVRTGVDVTTDRQQGATPDANTTAARDGVLDPGGDARKGGATGAGMVPGANAEADSSGAPATAFAWEVETPDDPSREVEPESLWLRLEGPYCLAVPPRIRLQRRKAKPDRWLLPDHAGVLRFWIREGAPPAARDLLPSQYRDYQARLFKKTRMGPAEGILQVFAPRHDSALRPDQGAVVFRHPLGEDGGKRELIIFCHWRTKAGEGMMHRILRSLRAPEVGRQGLTPDQFYLRQMGLEPVL